MLQEYNTRKLLERGVKSVMHDKHAISVAPPNLYASRFMDFVHKQVRRCTVRACVLNPTTCYAA